MATLFGGAGEQLAQAEQGLTRKVFTMGMSIYDKLENAEEISQFNLGQTQLTNAMNQADYERSTKGSDDFLQWQDQNTKAMDDAWGTIEKTLKNQGAKNQLNEWWQSQKIERSRKIEAQVIGTRIDNIRGDTDKAVTNELQTGDSFDIMEQKIGKLYDDGVRIGAFHPEEAEQKKVQYSHKIEYETLKKQAIDSIIQSGGDIESGLKLVYDNSSKFQYLTEDDVTKIAAFTELQGKFLVTQASEKSKKEDDTQYTDAADHVIAGDYSPDKISQLQWKNPVASKNNAASLIALYDKMHPKSGGKPVPTKIQYESYIKLYDSMISGQDDVAENEKTLIDNVNAGNITGEQAKDLIHVAQMGPGSPKQALTEANSVIKAGMQKADGSGFYDAEEAQRLITMMNTFVTNAGTKIDRKAVYDEAVRVSELAKDKVIDDSLKNALQKPATLWNLFQKGQPLYKDISTLIGDIKANKYDKIYDDPTVKELYSDAQNAVKDKLKDLKVPSSSITATGIDPSTHLPTAMVVINGKKTVYRLNTDKDDNVILDFTTDGKTWTPSTR